MSTAKRRDTAANAAFARVVPRCSHEPTRWVAGASLAAAMPPRLPPGRNQGGECSSMELASWTSTNPTPQVDAYVVSVPVRNDSKLVFRSRYGLVGLCRKNHYIFEKAAAVPRDRRHSWHRWELAALVFLSFFSVAFANSPFFPSCHSSPVEPQFLEMAFSCSKMQWPTFPCAVWTFPSFLTFSSSFKPCFLTFFRHYWSYLRQA